MIEPCPPRMYSAWKMTIKATGQELCGDCISAQYANWWREGAQRLIGYGRHRSNCALEIPNHVVAGERINRCTCGFDELRQAIEEESMKKEVSA